MKIRLGHISNSSSASFAIPSFFLTDEQKEMLLSLDDDKKIKAQIQEKLGKDFDDEKYNWEDSKNDYPKNEEFHAVYKKMRENKEFYDSWNIGERHEEVSGSTWMDNGCLRVLMEKIGVDLTAVQWNKQCGIERATNPEAIKFFIEKYHEWFKTLTEDDIKFHKESLGVTLTGKSLYEMTEEEFKKVEEEDW